MVQQFTHAHDVMGIYVITNTVTGKAYIGSSVCIRKRWWWHRSQLRRGAHHSAHLQAAWLKYGEAAFSFAIIEQVADIADLEPREQAWLNERRTFDREIGYNLVAVAAGGGWTASADLRARLSEQRRAKGKSDAWREARARRVATDAERAQAAELGRSWRGRKRSVKQRRQISERQRGTAASSAVLNDAHVVEIMWRLANGETQGAIAALYGIHQCTVSDIKHGRTWQHVTGRTYKPTAP